MNILDQARTSTSSTAGCGSYGQSMPAPQPQKPSMGAKLSKVADIFELDIINEDEALKACKVIIEQHAKAKGKTGKDE